MTSNQFSEASKRMTIYAPYQEITKKVIIHTKELKKKNITKGPLVVRNMSIQIRISLLTIVIQNHSAFFGI